MGTNRNSSGRNAAKQQLWVPFISSTVAGIVGGVIGWIFFSRGTGLTVLVLGIAIGAFREAQLRRSLTK